MHTYSGYSAVKQENKHTNRDSKCPATPSGLAYKEKSA